MTMCLQYRNAVFKDPFLFLCIWTIAYTERIRGNYILLASMNRIRIEKLLRTHPFVDEVIKSSKPVGLPAHTVATRRTKKGHKRSGNQCTTVRMYNRAFSGDLHNVYINININWQRNQFWKVFSDPTIQTSGVEMRKSYLFWYQYNETMSPIKWGFAVSRFLKFIWKIFSQLSC